MGIGSLVCPDRTPGLPVPRPPSSTTSPRGRDQTVASTVTSTGLSRHAFIVVNEPASRRWTPAAPSCCSASSPDTNAAPSGSHPTSRSTMSARPCGRTGSSRGRWPCQDNELVVEIGSPESIPAASETRTPVSRNRRRVAAPRPVKSRPSPGLQEPPQPLIGQHRRWFIGDLGGSSRWRPTRRRQPPT